MLQKAIKMLAIHPVYDYDVLQLITMEAVYEHSYIRADFRRACFKAV
jgi:hypothetical protein